MSQDDIIIQHMAKKLRLRIAMVTETFPPEVNGVAMTLGRMVEGLLARGHSIQMVRPRQSEGDVPRQEEHFQETLGPGVPIPRYGGLRFGLPLQSRLCQLWSRQRPDLVHVATEGPLGWSAVAAARKLKLPVTSDFHTNFDHYSRHYGFGWLKRPVAGYLKRFHNRTAATFVPTAEMAQELGRQGYVNLQVLARGVDRKLFDPARRSEALRREWGLGPDDLAVLVVSRLAPEKNLPLALRAFQAIQSVRPDARLILVGDGPARKSLAQGCPRTHFAGMRTGEDLASHYASGDLFLFPSLTETFGNVTLEAMSSGLPVVAYRCAAAGEVIEDGQSGLLAPPGHEDAFIAAARRLAAEPELRRQLGPAARERVAPIDWERIHERLETAFLHVVRRHQRLSGQENHFLQIVPD